MMAGRVVLALAASLLGHAAWGAVCGPGETADALRPLPPALVPQAVAAFGLHGMTPAEVTRTTVVRCVGGAVWACNAGANLPCGKADEDQAPVKAAARDWCAAHPDEDFVPAYIAGHDSAWRWRCVGGAPATVGQPAAVDARGFFAAYWKRLG